jgi:hypothetical protein
LPSCLLSRNVNVKIYKTIILPVVLCECETQSLTVREEHRLRVLENRVLERIFEPKRDKITRKWRKSHNGELHNLYTHPIIIRQIKSKRMSWVGHMACMGEKRKVYKVLMGKPKVKRLLGRMRHSWENGIKMDLWETRWKGVVWIGTSGGFL